VKAHCIECDQETEWTEGIQEERNVSEFSPDKSWRKYRTYTCDSCGYVEDAVIMDMKAKLNDLPPRT